MINIEKILGKSPFKVLKQEYLYSSKLHPKLSLNRIISIYDFAPTPQEGLARARDYMYFNKVIKYDK